MTFKQAQKKCGKMHLTKGKFKACVKRHHKVKCAPGCSKGGHRKHKRSRRRK